MVNTKHSSFFKEITNIEWQNERQETKANQENGPRKLVNQTRTLAIMLAPVSFEMISFFPYKNENVTITGQNDSKRN